MIKARLDFLRYGEKAALLTDKCCLNVGFAGGQLLFVGRVHTGTLFPKKASARKSLL
jgi:hypothetical protein